MMPLMHYAAAQGFFGKTPTQIESITTFDTAYLLFLMLLYGLRKRLVHQGGKYEVHYSHLASLSLMKVWILRIRAGQALAAVAK